MCYRFVEPFRPIPSISVEALASPPGHISIMGEHISKTLSVKIVKKKEKKRKKSDDQSAQASKDHAWTKGSE